MFRCKGSSKPEASHKIGPENPTTIPHSSALNTPGQHEDYKSNKGGSAAHNTSLPETQFTVPHLSSSPKVPEQHEDSGSNSHPRLGSGSGGISDVWAWAWPEAHGLGLAYKGLGLFISLARPSIQAWAWPGLVWAQAQAYYQF